MAMKKSKSTEAAQRKKQHAMQTTILAGKPTTLPSFKGEKKAPTKKAASSMYSSKKKKY